MKKTWAKVKKKSNQKLEEIKRVVTTDMGFKVLRQKIRENEFCVPYIGLFLTDLTFLQDGHKSLNDQGMLNFSKFKLFSRTINNFMKKQNKMYNLPNFCVSISMFIESRFYNIISINRDHEAYHYKIAHSSEPRI